MSFYHINHKNLGNDEEEFNPYERNGGTVVAIAGDNYVVIGADTRLILRHSIISRYQDKLFKLSPTNVLGASGCWADVMTFTKTLKLRVDMYAYDNHKPISTAALAQLISVSLYYKRFFPYYVSNVLAGLDDDGKGVVYSYDPVGHCDKCNFTASGTAGQLLMPLLDNQLENIKKPFSENKAIQLLKDGFTCAAERDVATGDFVQIYSIRKGKEMCEERFRLRED